MRLATMSAGAFPAFAARSAEGFAGRLVASGLLPEAQARAYARDQQRALLPHGPATSGHLLWTVHQGEEPVGDLWLQLRPDAGGTDRAVAYLLDLEVTPRCRGRGIGRAALLAAHDEAVRCGATRMQLTVFGLDHAALALYTRLGYLVDQATLTWVAPAEQGRAAAAGRGAVDLRDMTEADLDALRSALRTSGADPGRLPFGPATSGHRLWTAWQGPTLVGRVWLELQRRADGLHAWVRYLDGGDDPPAGPGAEVIGAVQHAAGELGSRTVTVDLPGSGPAAVRAAYDACGFRLTAQTMGLALTGRR